LFGKAVPPGPLGAGFGTIAALVALLMASFCAANPAEVTSRPNSAPVCLFLELAHGTKKETELKAVSVNSK
jgi:hypothetical protein